MTEEKTTEKITKLTPEQEVKLPEYRDRWLKIGLATGPCDRKLVESIMCDVYKAADVTPPDTFAWVSSPLEGAKAAMELLAQEGEQNKEESAVYNCGFGQHDAGWLGFYEFFLREVGLEECKPLEPLMRLAEHTGWWWPFEKTCIISERPVALHMDEQNRLHCETGKAVEYKDGWGVYAWHGVRVPDFVIERPQDITLEHVLKEENQEIRRVMLDRYGWDKMLENLGAETVHEDEKGRLVKTTRMGEYLQGEDPEARYVLVVDPSTQRRYALRVPPTMQTATEAVAWTYDVDPKTYNPVKES